MKRIFIFAAAALLVGSIHAQDEGDDIVVLPPDAQACVLPASPDAIPEEASYDDLVKAKSQISEFQSTVAVFRECLSEAEANPDITAGNKQAIVNSFNYSVEMEERIAERFNEAVRDYKARKAAAEG